MNKLPALLTLLLSASALAGGGGPRPVRPLAAGQVWQMDYQLTDKATQSLTLTVKQEARFSPDSQGARTFEAEGATTAKMLDFPAPYLAAAIEQPFLFCIIPINAVKTGYVLTGAPEEVWQLFPRETPEYTPAEVYAITKKANLGTCTLKRLR